MTTFTHINSPIQITVLKNELHPYTSQTSDTDVQGVSFIVSPNSFITQNASIRRHIPMADAVLRKTTKTKTKTIIL
jgi:hypothetical protein